MRFQTFTSRALRAGTPALVAIAATAFTAGVSGATPLQSHHTAAPNPTVVDAIQAWLAPGVVNPQLKLGPAQKGQCLSGSRVNYEPSAWRCLAGPNSIVEPCFASPTGAAGASAVLCVPAPWSDAFMLKLTSPLPFSSENGSSNPASPPLGIELANGSRCIFSDGAILILHGVPLAYSCNVGAAGGLDRSSRVWTVEYNANVKGGLQKVAVTKAWTLSSPAPGGPWNSPELLITPGSLGAVRVGMTFAQAERAAGEALQQVGDGMVYPASPPAHVETLFGGMSGTRFVCVAAGTAQGSQQTVVTPQGYQLGDSLGRLRQVYGNSLIPYHTPPGLADFAGFLVHANGGTFVFRLDSSGQHIIAIEAGPAKFNPVSCSG